MWGWIWRVGPRLVNAFSHIAERYRGVPERRRGAESPIIRRDIELAELPRVGLPLPVDRPRRVQQPTRKPPPVPSTSNQPLPPLPSRLAGPNTASSVWDDSELGE
jgi:hypothetical protein